MKIKMATGTFKVTAKPKGYRRNTTKSFPVMLFGWAGLAVMLLATAFLAIDPVLVRSAYLGGSNNDVRNDIAVDSAHNAYIAGRTNSVTSQTQCIAGELDTSFNPGAGVTRGVSTTGFSQAVNALAVQPDGKVLAGGRFVHNDDSFAKLIVRFNSDGSRDTSFNSPRSSGIIAPNGTLPRVLALARQADWKVVIGGDFKIDGESRNGIARLNSDGSLDTSFNPGTGVNDEILALAVQPDGKIVIAGNFTQYNGVSRPRVARLNTDGSLDTSFAPGTGAHSRVQAVGIQADGKIIIGGFFDTYNGVTRNDIARINTDGSLDTTFGSGTGANEIRALAIQSDGKVVIGGTFQNYNGVGRNRVARVNTNGSLDTTFDPGTAANSTVRALAIQTDGRIVIGGAFQQYNGVDRNKVARINTNGSIDPTFGPGTAPDTTVSVSALALQTDGKVVIGGNFIMFDGERRNRVARLNGDGTLDASFILTAQVGSSVRALAVQSDGKIIIGGFFDRYNGVTRNNIARLNSDGSLDTSFDPSAGTSGKDFVVDGSVWALAIQADGKILIGGAFNQDNGVSRNKIARLNSNGSLDTTFDPGTGAGEDFSEMYAIEVLTDGKILIGGVFEGYNGVIRDGIARINSNGSLDTTFVPSPINDQFVDDIAVQPDGKILIGGGFDRFVARLNSNGSPDGSFNPGTGGTGPFPSGLADIVLQPDEKVVIGGSFTQYNGVGRKNIARINSNGSLDTTFDPGTGPNDIVFGLGLQSDCKILIGGSFTQYNGVTNNRVARLNANGSLDTSFGSGTRADRGISTLTLQPDGRILIGGFFNNYDGVSRNNIARLNSCLPPATFQFSQSNVAVSESAGFVNVTVTRTGDTGTVGTVDYTTSDNSDVIPDEAQAVALCGTVNGVALSKCDFNTAVGTLRFAAGETTKSFTVLLTQDSYVEGTEQAPLTLSNPTNGIIFCNQGATLQINDDPTEPSTNPIDDNRNFVRQHYHDFLNREPDGPGWDFWTDNITQCNDPARIPAGQTVAQCIDKQRETTSGAFFLSPEFQYTGQYVDAVYKGSLGRMPNFREFMRDVQEVSRGIIVANVVSASTIEANRAQYLTEFIQRPEFANIYALLTNQGYVDRLFLTTGTSVSAADRQALVNALNGGTETRAAVLHKVVNGTRVLAEGQVEITAAYGKAFFDTQFSPSFVQMEYFGYLRRNEDTPGFTFWLNKLNSFGGDFIKAEMVRSFLMSPEYRRRFGSQ